MPWVLEIDQIYDIFENDFGVKNQLRKEIEGKFFGVFLRTFLHQIFS